VNGRKVQPVTRRTEPVTVRSLELDDLDWMLRVNNAAVPAVNPHDASSLRALVDDADRCWVAVAGTRRVGMLVTFGPGASYESSNYRWLSERFEDFRYVDRIVVVPDAKGRGVGRALYGVLEEHAASVEAQRMLCEVNIEPPNPMSVAFHTAMGWSAVADRDVSPGKAVRYFEKRVG
jgi:predicted GNAT superfamily acetyltransferase